MEKQIIIRILALTVALGLILTGCATPVANQASAKPSAVETQKPDAAKTDTPATEAPTPAASEAPAVNSGSCPAFKYYNAIQIGMTKDEADKALGLTPKEAKGEYDPENAYYYTDAEGYGVYVLYNKSNKLYSKTVQYKDVAKDLAPLTATPVTEALCDKITDGMKREDVAKLLGGDGAECSATAIDTETCKNIGPIVRWGNQEGSFIQVVFLPDGKAKNPMYFEH